MSKKIIAVHPHACGDNKPLVFFSDCDDGSPPRLWGQRRIRVGMDTRSTVHPHACGDNRRL